jgi:hypothetical protein
MSRIFSNSITQPVYYKAGQQGGRDVFLRAPFDVVKINGALHVQPRSIGLPDQAFAMLNSGNTADQAMWRSDMAGFEILHPIVLDENQMGDGTDNWMGLNAVSDL